MHGHAINPSRNRIALDRARGAGVLDRSRSLTLCSIAVLPILLALCASSVSAQARLDGENGLWVTDWAGELGVRWLTTDADEGYLEVISRDGARLHRAETVVSQAHSTSFPRPSESVVTLRYGSLGATDLNATIIYLEDEAPPDLGVVTGVDSLYVVGDIHGEYERLLALLGNAGLVDPDGAWIGGTRHVVFLGDIFDRGPDVQRTLWFLYRLEREARAAGGGAHVVLGNHETMIFTHDVRYISDKEQSIAVLHGEPYPALFDIRQSVLGRWLAGRPGVMRIDDVLLAHGGVLPGVAPPSVEAVNDSLRAFMAEDLFYRWADSTLALVTDSATAEVVRSQYDAVILMDSTAVARRFDLIFDERSIFWFRGYVESDTLVSQLDQVLDDYGAQLHVVAHTPVPTIESRYDGRLLAVDLEVAASELLLLVKEPEGGYGRWKIGLEGPPEPIPLTPPGPP